MAESPAAVAPRRVLRRLADRLQRRGPLLRVLGGLVYRFDRILEDPGELPILWRRARLVWRLGGTSELLRILGRRMAGAGPGRLDYAAWVHRYDRMSSRGERRLRRKLARLRSPPLFLVLLEGDAGHSTEDPASSSLERQLYGRWRRIEEVADPGESNQNGFILRLHRADRLPPYAFAALALELGRRPACKLLIFDHDQLAPSGERVAPVFKPQWNEALLLAGDYVGPAFVARRDLADGAGLLAPRLTPAGRYRALLAAARELRPDEIGHLPQLLLHLAPDAGARGGLLAQDRALWGGPALVPAWPADERPAALAALKEHLEATGAQAEVAPNPLGPGLRLDWATAVAQGAPLVEILVPTRDRLDLLGPCLRSLLERTDYSAFRLTVIDNDSREPETLRFLADLGADPRVTVRRDPRPFNYAALNNAAVASSRAPLVCLMNNDIEALAPDWLTEMVGWTTRPGVAAVGACLTYPDDSLQHAGVTLGLGDAAGHLYRGLPSQGPGAPLRALVAQELSAVTAACLLIERACFLAVGGMDEESFPVAYNDVDLCLKVTASGRKIVWTPHARLIHYESQSRGLTDTPEKLARQLGEIRQLRRRWLARLGEDPNYNPNLTIYDEQSSLAWPPRLERPWL